MEKNEDPLIVVMSRDIADTLMHYANIGAFEAGHDISHLEKHVRRWNIEVSAEHQAQIVADRKQKAADIAATKQLLRHCGELIYMELEKYVLAEVKLVSIGRTGKDTVRVHDQVTGQFHDAVNIHRVHNDLPEEYRLHMVGRWQHRYIHNLKTVNN